MGTINHATSEYLTLAFDVPEGYTDLDASDTYDRAFAILHTYDFCFYHVTLCLGYYEGLSLQIERNFPVCYDSYQEKLEAQKEAAQLRRLLLELANIGFLNCFPGWCTGWSDATGTRLAIREAVQAMREDIKATPTYAQYTRGVS